MTTKKKWCNHLDYTTQTCAVKLYVFQEDLFHLLENDFN